MSLVCVLQCCEPTCLKWRKLPVGETAADPKYNGDWFCEENPDKRMALRGHNAPQELDEVRLCLDTSACYGCGSHTHCPPE